jgi:hypothetical protein
MGIALHSLSGLMARILQRHARALTAKGASALAPGCAPATLAIKPLHPRLHTPAERPGHFPVRRDAQEQLHQRPLRVLQISDPRDRRGVIGRLVISGRMADVCAELDRLAGQEALTQAH